MANRPTLRKSIRNTIIGLLVLIALLFGFKLFQLRMIGKFLANYQPPPIAITAQTVKEEVWQKHVNTIGTIVAINGVEVTSQISGEVANILFQSGQPVKQGDLLLQLDDRVEQAQRKVYQATLDYSQIEFKRLTKLYERGTISQDEYDKAASNLKIAESNLEQVETLIDQKAIKAPFPGIVGIKNVYLGEYIKPGDPIVTLQDLSKVHVDFSLPEIYLPQLYEGQTVKFTVDSFSEAIFTAKITAINPKIDVNSHMVAIRALTDNSDHRLVPGMYADVNVIMKETMQLITVPSTAVTYSLYGDSVYVVKGLTQKQLEQMPVVTPKESVTENYETYTVEVRTVTVADQREGWIGVKGNIKSGEVVATSNLQQLKNDTPVIVNNSIKLPTKLTQ